MFDYLCDLVEYAVDTVIDNPVESLVVAAATVATGGVALAAAPAIGAAASAAGIGTAAGTLSGAAAASAGLAGMAGGSIASGGLGVVGGKALVTVTGAGVGATVSGTAISTTKD